MMTDSLKPVRPKRLLRLVAAVAAAVVVYALYAAAPAVAREIVSYAIIQDDATLRVRGETVRLFGIFVPDQSRRCRTRIRPVRCGLNRAAEALDFKIQGFVRCEPVRRARDGSIEAFCSTGEGPRSEMSVAHDMTGLRST